MRMLMIAKKEIEDALHETPGDWTKFPRETEQVGPGFPIGEYMTKSGLLVGYSPWMGPQVWDFMNMGGENSTVCLDNLEHSLAMMLVNSAEGQPVFPSEDEAPK